MKRENDIDLIDFHTHILPNVDHGSSSLSTSLRQIDIARYHGINKIFATSHFYPHRHIVPEFLKKRNEAYKSLINSPAFSNMEIKLGAEILLCDNLHNLDGLSELAICGTNYLLIELPFFNFSDSYIYETEKLIQAGYKVILAHADRYAPENIDILVSQGAEIQLNADALSSFFKKKHLFKWIDAGIVVGVGSDIHGVDEKAYRNFDKAKSKIGESIGEIKRKSDEIWEKALLL